MTQPVTILSPSLPSALHFAWMCHRSSQDRSSRGSRAPLARRWLAPLVTLAAALLPTAAAAQQLAVTTYAAEDGPAHPQVWNAHQDSRGLLWLGTSQGLSRWDGVAFQSFSGADGLDELTIRTIVEDPAGHLWLGSDGGIARFDGTDFTSFTAAAGAPATGVVWCSTRDAAGRLWFGTEDGGAVSWDGSGFRSFTTDHGLASSYVYAIVADRRGFLWLGHRGHGLTRCHIAADGALAACHTFTTADGLAHGEVRALVEDRAGNLWVGTRGGGVSRWDGASFTTFTVDHGLAEDDIYALLVSDDGHLVVGTTRRGITLCDLPDVTDCRSYGMRNGLPDDAVLDLLEDRDGNLWVALSNGLSLVWSRDAESYTLRDGLPSSTVYSAFVDGDGSVWAGTTDGLARIDDARRGATTPAVVGWDSEGVLPGHEVWDLGRDQRGWLWVATERGLCRFSDGHCDLVLTADDGLADSDLFELCAASDGSLWVGTVNGVSRLRFTAAGAVADIASWTTADGLPGPGVTSLAEDDDGTMWLATDGGLAHWDGHTITAWGATDGLPAVDILSLARDDRGHLWLGTDGGGLVEATTDSGQVHFTHHGVELGLPSLVETIHPVGSTLWLGSGDGLYHYQPTAEPPTARLLAHHDAAAGLAGLEVNAIASAGPDVLWLATTGGLTRLHVGHSRPEPAPPVVRVDSVRTVSGSEWRAAFTAPSRRRDPAARWLETSQPELGHDFAAIRLDFRALSFGPHQARFQVRLTGFDDAWSTPTTSPFKEYMNLDPGRYTFAVRAAVVGDRWSEPAVVAITVVPAWWQTTWTKAGAAFALLAVVWGGVRLRTTRIRQRAAELERAVAERTDDLSRYARALEDHSLALDWANVEIRHADRVKSEFLANMSHELRTPLNSIIGFSDVLARRLGERLDERELKFLRNVSRSGRYLLLLINNLLDLSKIEADRMDLHLESVNLPRLLEDTLKVVQGYASDRSVEVKLTIGDEPTTVEVDVAKFNQIIINLLSNAVKFSSPGDLVEVTVRAVSATETPLAVPCYELSVSDHGPGIPEEDRAVIFEVFCQGGGGATHPGGTGLGLALVQKYVTMMGGQVDFRSALGQGSTFWVVLPVNPVPLAPVTKRAVESLRPEEPIRRPCVLIIDHDRRHFATMASALEQEGLLPVRAGDATDALHMVEGLRPAALVFLWDAATVREWRSLAMVLGPAADLPILIGAQGNGPEPVTLAADVCLSHPLRLEDLTAVVHVVGARANDAVLIAGADPGVREGVRSRLAEESLQLVDLASADAATVGSAALALLDLTGHAAAAVVAAAAERLPRTMPRIVLLPTKTAPELAVLAPGSSPPPTELAVELKVLLTRRVQRKRVRSLTAPTGGR